MKLSMERRKRIAKACRQLAYQTAEGRGPQLNPFGWCGCAIGEAIKMAGVRTTRDSIQPLAFEIDALLPSDNLQSGWNLGLVSRATTAQVVDHVEGATVFPLLALADALERK